MPIFLLLNMLYLGSTEQKGTVHIAATPQLARQDILSHNYSLECSTKQTRIEVKFWQPIFVQHSKNASGLLIQIQISQKTNLNVCCNYWIKRRPTAMRQRDCSL